MATSKQASRHTHAHAQCTRASVGLAQARPNNIFEPIGGNLAGMVGLESECVVLQIEQCYGCRLVW